MALTTWEHGLNLLSALPDLALASVIEDGPVHTSLARIFGREGLAEFEADVIEEFLLVRTPEDIRDVVLRVSSSRRWSGIFTALSPLRRFRTIERVTEEVMLNLRLLVVRVPPLRGWLGADW